MTTSTLQPQSITSATTLRGHVLVVDDHAQARESIAEVRRAVAV